SPPGVSTDITAGLGEHLAAVRGSPWNTSKERIFPSLRRARTSLMFGFHAGYPHLADFSTRTAAVFHTLTLQRSRPCSASRPSRDSRRSSSVPKTRTEG